MKLRYAVKRFFSSNNKLLVLILLAVVAAVLSVSYAVFTTTSESHGALNIETGVLYSKLISNQLDVENEVVVAPGQTKFVNIDIKNTNSIDAKFNLYYSLSKANANVEVKLFTSSEIPDNAGMVVTTGNSKTIKIRIVNNDTENVVVSFGSNAGLVNDTLTKPASKTYITEKLPLCKRATTLHSEVCTQSSGYCADDGYAMNAQVQYGNPTPTAGVLTTGDAYDCDINGDGIYDGNTERFYYVSTKSNGIDVNNDVAVFVYYNNTKLGVASIAGGAYALQADTGGTNRNENWHGPITALKDLPKLTGDTAWSNAVLLGAERQITNEINETVSDEEILPGADDNHPKFNYNGSGVRLLTYQEVNAGCFDGVNSIDSAGGLSSKCKFLMENTKYTKSSNTTYGTWLETVDSADSTRAWEVASDISGLATDTVSRASFRGVRPAIEVEAQYVEK